MGRTMIQGLRLLLVTLFALYHSSLFAVGLGNLEVKSHLNQRFDAEIVLTNVGVLGPDEIIADLASRENFDRLGIARGDHLTDLRFSVRQREDGESIVHVTSGKPIIELYLHFVVEVTWPTGKILREYTALIDPPVFSTGGTGGAEETAPATVRRTPGSTDSNDRASAVGVTRQDEYGLTGSGDTLWTIASKVRPNNGVSVQQTMLALLRANPEAFFNNNINQLKAGHVLRIPDINEIRAASTGDAVTEVRVQNEEYEEYRSGDVTQFDARRRAQRDEVRSDAGEDGELKLLGSDRSAGDRSGEDHGRVAELENELAIVREDLDRERRANSEMHLRLDDLEKQIETLSEVVQLKDDQLAALTAALNRQQPTTQTGGPLLSNPLVVGGLGLLLIAIVAGGLLLMRRRSQSGDDDAEDFPEVFMEDELSLPSADETIEEAEQMARQTGDVGDVGDVIGEAEIDIAYGRFPEAIDVLKDAIEDEPGRVDIRLKLLEVYVQTEDVAAFEQQLEQLKLIGDEDATDRAMALQAQIPGAAEASADSMDVSLPFEPIAAMEAPAAADEAEEPSHDEAMQPDDADLDLDLDDIYLDDMDEGASSKLDLARAYIEMGDGDGARSLLEQVLREGDDQQISEANELLGKIG